VDGGASRPAATAGARARRPTTARATGSTGIVEIGVLPAYSRRQLSRKKARHEPQGVAPMTSSTTSTLRPGRPRLRRSLAGVACAAACAAPLALAPAASAQSGGPLGGIEVTLADTITALPNTLTHPLGGSSGDRPPGNDACVDPELVSPLLSCVIDTVADVLGGRPAATTKATVRRKVRAARRHTRMSRKFSR
jgi:hypothetical protein